MLHFRTTHPETGEPIEVIADYFPAHHYQDREMPDEPEEVRIKRVYAGGEEIEFANIESELERLGLEHQKQLNRSEI